MNPTKDDCYTTSVKYCACIEFHLDEDPAFKSAVQAKQVGSKTTGEVLGLDDMHATLQVEQTKLQRAETTLAKVQREFVLVFNCQIASFSLGLLLNAAYIARNFLRDP